MIDVENNTVEMIVNGENMKVKVGTVKPLRATATVEYKYMLLMDSLLKMCC